MHGKLDTMRVGHMWADVFTSVRLLADIAVYLWGRASDAEAFCWLGRVIWRLLSSPLHAPMTDLGYLSKESPTRFRLA